MTAGLNGSNGLINFNSLNGIPVPNSMNINMQMNMNMNVGGNTVNPLPISTSQGAYTGNNAAGGVVPSTKSHNGNHSQNGNGNIQA